MSEENFLPEGAEQGMGNPTDVPTEVPMEAGEATESPASEITPDFSVRDERGLCRPFDNLLAIENIDDFAKVANTPDVIGFGSERLILNFLDAYNQINKGCSCSRKKRIRVTEEMYLKMNDLPPNCKLHVKAVMSSPHIWLYHNGAKFAEF